LVVAEHDDDIGRKFVERLPRFGKMAAINRARPAGRRGAPIAAQFFAQRRRPMRGVLHRGAA
jgi:hypothetical protein